MKFSAQNAREFAAKSHIQHRLNRDLRKNQPIQPDFPQDAPTANHTQLATDLPDAFSQALAYACDDTLMRLTKAANPLHRAQLARALRDLRETWHLATGKPRPGLTRPDMVKPVRREIPRSVQPMFNANGHSQNTP